MPTLVVPNVVDGLPDDMPAFAQRLLELLRHEQAEWRQAGVSLLGRLEPKTRALHASAAIPCIYDADLDVRRAAVSALHSLEPEDLAELADDIAELLVHGDWDVRAASAFLLAQLPEPSLAKYIPQLVQQFDDSDAYARVAALEAFEELSSDCLLEHAGILLPKMLSSGYRVVRMSAISLLKRLAEDVDLTQHAATLAAQLRHSDTDIRNVCVRAFCDNMEAETILPHAGALAERLQDTDAATCRAAKLALDKLKENGEMALIAPPPALPAHVDAAMRVYEARCARWAKFTRLAVGGTGVALALGVLFGPGLV